jgi:D-alanyl-D-alanine dipeptidase
MLRVNNFTQRKLYPIARCYLRKRVAERLAEVQ